jgi:hypothetical protein
MRQRHSGTSGSCSSSRPYIEYICFWTCSFYVVFVCLSMVMFFVWLLFVIVFVCGFECYELFLVTRIVGFVRRLEARKLNQHLTRMRE